jgi:alpha-amylase
VPGRDLPAPERKLASRGELEAGLPLELVNDWDKFFVRVSCQPATLTWRYPLETASQSEGGFERTYQGSVILPVWRNLPLGDGQPFNATVTIELEQIPHA